MSSLYIALKRYADRKSELDSAYRADIDGSKIQYYAGLNRMTEDLLERMGRFYRNNMIVREAVNGKRSVRETAEEYTMHGDMVLPGTVFMEEKLRRVNMYLRGATGIPDPLDTPFFGSGERKIERIRGRAGIVDIYLNEFAEDVIARVGKLPNSDELQDKRRPVRDFINGQVDYVLDLCCGD
jgi:hypothetical protein